MLCNARSKRCENRHWKQNPPECKKPSKERAFSAILTRNAHTHILPEFRPPRDRSFAGRGPHGDGPRLVLLGAQPDDSARGTPDATSKHRGHRVLTHQS